MTLTPCRSMRSCPCSWKFSDSPTTTFGETELHNGSGTHVAGHERGVHGHPAEVARELAGVQQAVDLGVHDHGPVLDPAVPSGGDQVALNVD